MLPQWTLIQTTLFHSNALLSQRTIVFLCKRTRRMSMTVLRSRPASFESECSLWSNLDKTILLKNILFNVLFYSIIVEEAFCTALKKIWF